MTSSPFQAALENAVYFQRPDTGYLEIHGDDRVDFLQRQSTNDLSLLAPNRAVNNVLTSATARILETFLMLEGDDHISLLVPRGRVDNTETFLKNHIFFMDKIEVRNQSDDWNQLEIHGGRAEERLKGMGINQLPRLDEVVEIDFVGNTIRLVGIQGLTSELSFLLLAHKAIRNKILGTLKKAGLKELGQDEYQILRVEAGLPAVGHELTADYTPLESGIAHWVSDTKGCYTGQEVIARQITYDKVTKFLVQLKLEQMVEQGAKVLVDGKAAGAITSSANSPSFGPIAMAILKRPYNFPGTVVEVENGGGHESSVSASVVVLKLPSQNT